MIYREHPIIKEAVKLVENGEVSFPTSSKRRIYSEVANETPTFTKKMGRSIQTCSSKLSSIYPTEPVLCKHSIAFWMRLGIFLVDTKRMYLNEKTNNPIIGEILSEIDSLENISKKEVTKIIKNYLGFYQE